MSTPPKHKPLRAAKQQNLWTTGQKQKLGFAAVLFVAALVGSSTAYFLPLFVAAFLVCLWGLFGSGKRG